MYCKVFKFFLLYDLFYCDVIVKQFYVKILTIDLVGDRRKYSALLAINNLRKTFYGFYFWLSTFPQKTKLWNRVWYVLKNHLPTCFYFTILMFDICKLCASSHISFFVLSSGHTTKQKTLTVHNVIKCATKKHVISRTFNTRKLWFSQNYLNPLFWFVYVVHYVNITYL